MFWHPKKKYSGTHFYIRLAICSCIHFPDLNNLLSYKEVINKFLLTIQKYACFIYN